VDYLGCTKYKGDELSGVGRTLLFLLLSLSSLQHNLGLDVVKNKALARFSLLFSLLSVESSST
jgi:hypothetical protein